MEKQYFIYLTTNLVNNKKYIGQHKGFINDNYLGSGIQIKKALEKYGKNNFKREILEICQEHELDEKEKFWINYYDAFNSDQFYNLSEGGQNGDGWQAAHRWFKSHPEDAKQIYLNNLNKLNKWRQEHPEEVKNNINKMLEGNKKWREENPEIIFENMKKVNQKKEEWQKANPEQHQKQIEAWRKKGSETNSQKIKCLTTGEIFNSQCEAARFYGIPQGNISKCLKGERKSAGKHPITKEKLIWILVD